MQVTYTLTEEDLAEVQEQWLVAAQRERVREPWFLPAVVALAALVTWPLFAALQGRPLRPEGPLPLLEHLCVVAGAWLLVALLMPLAPAVVRSGRTPRWAARVAARKAAQQLVLGPVTVTLEEGGLTRVNARGESLRIGWEEVRDVLHAPGVLTVRRRGEARLVLVPARAFADADAAAAFRRRVEALSGKRTLEVGAGTPPPPRPDLAAWARLARGQALSAGLVLALALLARQEVSRHLYDPRAGNSDSGVIVYATQWCPVCTRLRTCLGGQGVPFDERDVDVSPQARAEWRELGGDGVPVIVVGQRVLYGLDPEALRGALAEAGHTADCSGGGR
jgi:glutaredoxin